MKNAAHLSMRRLDGALLPACGRITASARAGPLLSAAETGARLTRGLTSSRARPRIAGTLRYQLMTRSGVFE